MNPASFWVKQQTGKDISSAAPAKCGAWCSRNVLNPIQETKMQLPWDSKKRQPMAAKMTERPRSADLYHTYYWTRLSRAFRAEHPLCAMCLKEGRYTPAEVVDHITPYPICGDNGFFDRDNLQSLCQYHNIEKGNRDKKLITQYKHEKKETSPDGR